MATRNVTKSKLMNIQRIWAETGIVKVTDQNGVTRNMDIRTALLRAKSINNMPLPANLRAHQLELVEKILKVCQEAKYQIEGGSGNIAKTQVIQNVLSGKTAEGKDPSEVESEGQRISRYMFQFPTLTDTEIATVLRSPLEEMQKEILMRERHALRLREVGNPGILVK